MIFLRSLLFMVVLVIYTPLFATFFLMMRPLPGMTRYRIVQGWTRPVLWVIRHLLGIKYEVVGRENIPAEPCVVLCKHQSAWETMALQEVFPPVSFVLKKELLRIPFFGWGLASIPGIAIDRRARRNALEQVLEQGRRRLQEGFSVVIFPEGTRTAPGTTRPYKLGGAYLAARTGTQVVPVAHNAGEFWRRQAFLKYPGTVIMSIGPAIDTTGLKPEEINARAEAWIETEMRRISPHRYGVGKERVAA